MKNRKCGVKPQRCSWRQNSARLILPGVIASLLWHPLDLSAVGFRMPNQDPEGIARGNAFAATADNPSAIYYNPAGITQLDGQQVRVGIYMISADTTDKTSGGAKAETDTKVQAVPQLYYVNSLKNAPISLGLGVYAPYGLSLDYGNNTPIRTVAEYGQLLYACVNPVIAWRASSSFSVAIGPTINYSLAKLRRGVGLSSTDEFKFEGSALGYGFNAGLLWQPCSQWAFGVNYRSATTLNYDGHSETSPTSPFPPYYPHTSTRASINFPQYVAAGISFRPTENWNFEFDLDWTDWDTVDQIVFRGTPLGDIPFLLNYRSGFMYEAGATRKLGKGYFVSIGYIYAENSSPEKDFNPIIPDANLHLGSVGFGHKGQRYDWALGYHFAYNPERRINNNVNPVADGNYRTFNNAINISATIKFK